MSTPYQRLHARVEALQAKYDAMAAQPLAGADVPPRRHQSRRPRLHGTPQGLAALRETMVRLLARGDLWWRDTAPAAPVLTKKKETEP